jgi:hypothetical protein
VICRTDRVHTQYKGFPAEHLKELLTQECSATRGIQMLQCTNINPLVQDTRHQRFWKIKQHTALFDGLTRLSSQHLRTTDPHVEV